MGGDQEYRHKEFPGGPVIKALRSQCQGLRPHKSHMRPKKKSMEHRAFLENSADINVLFTWCSSCLLGIADTPGRTCSPLPQLQYVSLPKNCLLNVNLKIIKHLIKSHLLRYND